MARTRDKIPSYKKVELLAKSTGSTHKRLADQLVYKLGTSRRSEILGKIGKTGESFEKRFLDYLESL